MAFNTAKSKGTTVYSNSTPNSKFQSILLYDQHLSSYMYWPFETFLGGRMTWKNMRSKIPYISSTNTLWVSNFILFSSTASCLWDAGHFEIGTQINLKWPWTVRGQMCQIYVLLVLQSPKFYSDSFYCHLFLQVFIFPLDTVKFPSLLLQNFKTVNRQPLWGLSQGTFGKKTLLEKESKL